MNNLFEVLERLGPVIEVNLGTFQRNQQLFPLQDAQHSLQLAFRWLRMANEELAHQQGEVLEQGVETTKEGALKPPTLISPPEQFKYMEEQLTTILGEMQDYTSTVTLPPAVQYKTNRAYDNIMEALFDTKTANGFYNQITQHAGRNRG